MTPQLGTWDQRQFDAALTNYMLYTKRTVPEVLNAKIYYIGRNAIYATHKTDIATIHRELGQKVVTRTDRFKKDGTLSKIKKRTTTWTLAQARTKPIPLVWMIVNKRAKSMGYSIPRDQLDRAAKRFIGARIRSIGYLRSGWLAALKDIRPFVLGEKGLPPKSDVTQYGRARGIGLPAKPGSGLIVAKIFNNAGVTEKQSAALVKYGTPALASAFAQETAGMMLYVERHLEKGTRQTNVLLA